MEFYQWDHRSSYNPTRDDDIIKAILYAFANERTTTTTTTTTALQYPIFPITAAAITLFVNMLIAYSIS
jgi:hypothetical protein